MAASHAVVSNNNWLPDKDQVILCVSVCRRIVSDMKSSLPAVIIMIMVIIIIKQLFSRLDPLVHWPLNVQVSCRASRRANMSLKAAEE